jgi:hypothetical protein
MEIKPQPCHYPILSPTPASRQLIPARVSSRTPILLLGVRDLLFSLVGAIPRFRVRTACWRPYSERHSRATS